MKIKMNRDNLLLLVPLVGFALGTLYVGSSYGPVSAFIPFWASIFMLLTCLFVLAGFDKQGKTTMVETQKPIDQAFRAF